MKKKVAVMLACVMMFAGIGSALAQEAPAVPPVNESAVEAVDETAVQVQKLEVLKEFRDELHAVNGKRRQKGKGAASH
ncbi:hypothetical protein [Paenibacillus alkalitolerans]|uniref:hypothetical protein n=1 Tax=Paenibacillus alkalitolerans TaxID=2799335 RepID=UPI0018F5BDC7|nr:hypothetical protein [Paenibacillus alkalitolerans]